MWFFENTPKVDYLTNNSSNAIECVDITRRFKFVEKVLTNKYVLFNYKIKETDRPDIIAHKYYGDSTLDWIILLTNKIHDPYFDWPLTNREFDDFIKIKYGSLEFAKQNYRAYYQIIQPKEKTYDGFIVDEYRVEIDAKKYQTLSADVRYRASHYEHEMELNEAKRNIKLIDKGFIPEILKETLKIYE